MQQLPVLLDLCLRKTWTGNQMIIMAASFSKSSVFKLFPVHTETRSQHFQISAVGRTFSKSPVFVMD